MKRVFRLVVLVLVLATCALAFCSCLDVVEVRCKVQLREGVSYLTTDMSEAELRRNLKVDRQTGIFSIGNFYKEVDDYTVTCDIKEGINTITVIHDGKRSSVDALFVDKSKLSVEGDFVFCSILGNDYLLEYKGSDKNIVLPERAPYIIYNSVFANNENIESVVIGDSVKQIGGSAFAYSSIKSIDIGSGLESIGVGAFTACLNLVELNVSSIEQWCSMKFETVTPLQETKDCGDSYDTLIDGVYFYQYFGEPDYAMDYYYHSYGAKTATAEKGYINFFSGDGELVHKEYFAISNPVYFTETVCIDGEKIENLVIPETVTEVGQGFANSDIKSVSIHSKVVSIARSAFYGCKGLEKITISEVNKKLLDSYVYAFDLECRAFNKYSDVYYIGNDENPYLILIGLSKESEHTRIDVHEDTKAVASYSMLIYGGSISEIILSDSVEYVGEGIVRTNERSIKFTGGSCLRYIGKQIWFTNANENCVTDIYIGDLNNWYYDNENGTTIPVVLKPSVIGTFAISHPLYCMDIDYIE